MNQLEKLKSDSDAYKNFLDEQDGVKHLKSTQLSLRQSNTKEAEANLARQEELETLQAETTALMQQLQQTKQALQGKLQRQQAIAQVI